MTLRPLTTMGPLNNEANAVKFDEHVADARERGAASAAGAAVRRGIPTDLFAEPTVLDGCDREMTGRPRRDLRSSRARDRDLLLTRGARDHQPLAFRPHRRCVHQTISNAASPLPKRHEPAG